MDKKFLNAISTNERIVNIFNKIKSKEYILKPDFQRRLVWNTDHKERFIETILLGYPFPEIYIADGKMNLDEMKKETLVVDGQQRLDTIYHYIIGDIELKYKLIKRYKDLTDDEKENFLNYNVIVRDLKNVTNEEIKEVFRRINSVSYALNSMEINNALYNGEFIEAAKEICEMESFDRINIFGDSAVARMKDIEFVLLIMTTIELGTYFTGDKEVEDFIRRYDDEYSGKTEMINRLNDIFIYISELSIKIDSIWKSKNGLFTLICELAKFEELPQNELLIKALEDIERKAGVEDSEEEYKLFYMSFYQSTASKKSRVIRGNLLQKHLSEIKTS